MRMLIVILVLLLIGLHYKLWMGDGSIPQWHHLQARVKDQKNENKSLQERNRAMEADIMELKLGDQALEEQARSELGMIKDDEVYYQFVE